VTRIGDFRNLHAGKRLFILASGPSLVRLDLTALHRRIVMGLNRSLLLFPETRYHCAMDYRLFAEYGEELRRVRHLFTLEGRPWGIPLRLLGAEGFSWDLEEGVYSGYTIAYVALQIAVYMGFKEVFYLGLDLRHEGSKTHFFGHDFRSATHESTEFPRMRRMLDYGARVLGRADVSVFNCSPLSTLDCFPKVTYEYALSL
jgi:hypothetical protein